MQGISLIGFVIAVIILAASPGPGVFATISRALASGFNRALCLIVGIVLGDLVYLMMAIFGLSVVARTLGELFIFVRICGGIYLVWLGFKIWTSKAIRADTPTADPDHPKLSEVLGGLIITLSNPKVILFYCGFLPTFMDMNRLNGWQVMLVAGVVITAVAGVLAVYAFLATKARQFLRNGMMNRVAGGAMMTAGVTIAARS